MQRRRRDDEERAFFFHRSFDFFSVSRRKDAQRNVDAVVFHRHVVRVGNGKEEFRPVYFFFYNSFIFISSSSYHHSFRGDSHRFFTRVDADKSKSNVPFPRSFAQRYDFIVFPKHQTPRNLLQPVPVAAPDVCNRNKNHFFRLFFFFPLIVLHLERLFRSRAFLRLQFFPSRTNFKATISIPILGMMLRFLALLAVATLYTIALLIVSVFLLFFAFKASRHRLQHFSFQFLFEEKIKRFRVEKLFPALYHLSSISCYCSCRQ
mmetsp:Transcript_5895/g.18567  ORF Transcript_5895/g.18567 Transcript_5895/m.18567 type:complete len:262 (-) Transcript_5895:261-1046(-)